MVMGELGFVPATPAIKGLPAPDVRRACFRARKLFTELVYDTAALEDSPYTYPEVKTLLEKITVGGHRLEDQELILRQAKSWDRLLSLVEQGRFSVNRQLFCELQALVAAEEALTWGVFRDGDVSIAGTAFSPPSAADLDGIFTACLAEPATFQSPHHRGINFFLFGALNQFFYDGNKRTARLMMNGIIVSAGYDAISVPAARKLEFNQKMVRFYDTRDGAEMMDFMLSSAG